MLAESLRYAPHVGLLAPARSELKAAIERFACEISPAGVLGLVRHEPFPGARPAWCLANVYHATETLGGHIHFGWYFLLRRSREFGHYLMATHHAVWQPPGSVDAIDLTPLHPDRNHHPFLSDSGILFLLDRCAEPIVSEAQAIPLPTRFYPLTASDSLAAYLDRLRGEERAHYRRLLGRDAVPDRSAGLQFYNHY